MSQPKATWTIWWNDANAEQTTIEVRNEPTVAETPIGLLIMYLDGTRRVIPWTAILEARFEPAQPSHGDTSVPAA